MIPEKRKSILSKALCVLLALSVINQVVFPTAALALTGGPSQPEVQSFEPIGTTHMVDPFSGDFVYNIPLMDVDGYPLNISYHGGVTMEQEASWVGLGWNLNVGNVNRSMRGLPDDFSGREDMVTKNMHIQKNFNVGVNVNASFEFVGAPIGDYVTAKAGVGLNLGIFYNNYKGMGLELGFSKTVGLSVHDAGKMFSFNPKLTEGRNFNSQEGIVRERSVNLSGTIGGEKNRQAQAGVTFGSSSNTRSGLRQRTIGASAGVASPHKVKDKNTGKVSYHHGSPTGMNVSSTIPVGDMSYIPQVDMPMSNLSFTGSVGLGGEVQWAAIFGQLGVSYSHQKLAKTEQKQPAYGYLYADKANEDKSALYDINREKDGEYTAKKPMLPVTNFTYDIYAVSGQGLGGMYRPYRNDQGIVTDPLMESTGNGGNFGADFSIGAYFKLGLKGGYNSSDNKSGRWDDGSSKSAQSKLKFRGKDDTKPEYEPYYFKAAGELTPVNKKYYEEIGKEDPVSIEVTSDGKAKARFENGDEIANSQLRKRQARNQSISVLNAEEASIYGVENKIISCVLKADGTYDSVKSERVDSRHKKHHISEITTYRTDGARYVYGIPAYNITQKEVTFNVSKKEDESLPKDEASGLIKYNPGTDNSTGNRRGFDQLYNATTLPAYAHSYLLTAILSADYVDRTQNGPTDDDFGTYTKFTYRKHSDGYKWRTPYAADSANFDEGLKSDPYDDKGHYIYGEKEIWYLQAITTKTMVAEFSLSTREDNKGVADENGGPGTGNSQTTMKLDKITLYSKCERERKKEAAVPLEVVHFVYDEGAYPLCPGVPNNSGSSSGKGKLTLSEIYFTYQKSLKGKLNAYRFTYGSSENNFHYGLKSCDRWGNYKPNDPALPNDEFPYSEQDKTKADKYASAWSLTKIELPSGGKIEVNYEADDYAFVQDKRAMSMMSVTGLGSNKEEIDSDYLYTKDAACNYLKVKLPVPVEDKKEFRDKYLRNNFHENRLNTIYFRFLVDVIGGNNDGIKVASPNEYVSGYAKITDEYDVYGPEVDGKHNEAWIKLEDVYVGDNERMEENFGDVANPVARTAWQMVRIYMSKILHPGSGKSDPEESNEERLIQLGKAITGLFNDLKQNRNGVNHSMRTKGFARKAILDGKSRVRLYSPEYKKIGGGSRVRSILIDDNWKSMTNNPKGFNTQYGQIYEYTKVLEGSKTEANPEGLIISSGVAEYEPSIGNEENPLRQPLAYTVNNWMIPDNSHYVETPVGESFYPSASVGYSEIKVRSLQPGAGYIKHEFYTARDFPVVTEHTDIQRKKEKPKVIERMLKFTTNAALTVSQGHVIKLNNMHGQKKAMWVYAEGQEQPVSGQEFIYNTKNGNSRELSNTITAINKHGIVDKITVGKESDFVADLRQYISESLSLDAQGEIDTSPSLFAIPFPLPSVMPRYGYSSTKFRTATVTKVITTYGILKKVVAYDNGSYASTENIAFDAETGEVLVTKTLNNFNDPIYTFNYPAHWAYDRMGLAYKNLGVKIKAAAIEDGKLVLSNKKDMSLFVKGDELIVSGSNKRLWVNSVIQRSSGLTVELIDEEGEPAENVSGVSLSIVRSGRKNMQSLSVGTITMLENPIPSDDNQPIAFDKILSASAIEYSDHWPDYCECGIDNGKMEEVQIPGFDGGSLTNFVPNGNYFLQGAAGSWKVKRNYVYLAERNSSDENRNLNIREDGTYANFHPFWNSNNGKDWLPNKGKWVWTQEVSKMSPYGFEIENRDSLNNFSSAVFGYSNTLPIAVGQNSRYKEIGVDNFEDYNCTNCGGTFDNVDHWSFKRHADKIVNTVSHTGKNSIQVKKHSNVSVGKKMICVDKNTIPPV